MNSIKTKNRKAPSRALSKALSKVLLAILAAFCVCAMLGLCACAQGNNANNGETTSANSAQNANGANAGDSNSNAGSNSTANSNSSNANKSTQGTSTSNPGGTSEQNNANAGKSLVVYFSWSGNTKTVAEEIKAQTGADIFEITPADAYSTDYNDTLDRAKSEQQKNARPEIEAGVPNMSEYDTIYVGFPNWWDDMPMIIYTFFDTCDLSGKKVALFCTSEGSGLSGSVEEVKSIQPDANVVCGLHVPAEDVSSCAGAVSSWLSEI